MASVEKYARLVSRDELAAEDYNLNIRRYVDNSPPPEPHDVRAHLHGGVPVTEIDALQSYFENYQGVRDSLFVPRHSRESGNPEKFPLPHDAGKVEGTYMDFHPDIRTKDAIKPRIENAVGVKNKHEQLHQAVQQWWIAHRPKLEALPKTKNVFELRREFLETIGAALEPFNLLSPHKIRGAFASYINRLAADLKSVAASGWGAELIPEEDILKSQFPQVLEKLEQDRARIAELEALFASGDESENEALENTDEESETGVLPKKLVAALKEQRKALNGNLKENQKLLKILQQDSKKREKFPPRPSRESGKPKLPLDSGSELRSTSSILGVVPQGEGWGEGEMADAQAKAIEFEKEINRIEQEINTINAKLEHHNQLDQELKALKAGIKAAEKQKDDLVEAARAKITEDEARQLILERFRQFLFAEYDAYIRQYQQGFAAAIENLWNKYSVTVKQILAEREKEAAFLDRFMVELGYE